MNYRVSQKFFAFASGIGITLIVSRIILNISFIENYSAHAEKEIIPPVQLEQIKINNDTILQSPLATSYSSSEHSSLPFIVITSPTPEPSISPTKTNPKNFSNNTSSTELALKINTPILKPTSETTQEFQSNYLLTSENKTSNFSSDLPTFLSIPSINLNSSIVPVGYTYIGDKRTWEVPGYTVGTPKEQIKNNIILIGHTGLYNSIFKNLKKLEIGSKVFVDGKEYLVKNNLVTTVLDLKYVYPQESPKITFITCEGNKRRIVIASSS